MTIILQVTKNDMLSVEDKAEKKRLNQEIFKTPVNPNKCHYHAADERFRRLKEQQKATTK